MVTWRSLVKMEKIGQKSYKNVVIKTLAHYKLPLYSLEVSKQ